MEVRNFVEMDPYSVLGIDSNQSLEEIKAVYHQLAREYHPDKVDRQNTTEDISNKFLQIQEAWELIKTNHNLPKLFAMAETVKSDELIKIDETLYSFPCRCGDFYEIYVEDLEQNYNTFQCQGCSLYVSVEGYQTH